MQDTSPLDQYFKMLHQERSEHHSSPGVLNVAIQADNAATHFHRSRMVHPGIKQVKNAFEKRRRPSRFSSSSSNWMPALLSIDAKHVLGGHRQDSKNHHHDIDFVSSHQAILSAAARSSSSTSRWTSPSPKTTPSTFSWQTPHRRASSDALATPPRRRVSMESLQH